MNTINLPITYENPDTHQRKKRDRILQVAQTIKTRKQVNTKKFIAELELNGLRRKVALEYIEALTQYGWIKTEGEELIWIGPDNIYNYKKQN